MDNTLALITTTFNHYELTQAFVEDLKKQQNKNFTLYNIDCSTERKTVAYPSFVKTITIPNKGYAHNINVGIAQALKDGLEKFVIINNDVHVNQDFTASVEKAFTTHPGEIIGGKIYYEAGYEYHKERYTQHDLGNVLWYAGGSVDWNHALTPHRGVDEVDTGKYNHVDKTAFINGALMLYDKTVYEKIGPWDESYFLYFEDADFCEKAKKKGVELVYDPSIKMWHKISQSTGGSGSSLHTRFQESNRIKFSFRYGPLKTTLHLIKNYLLNKFHS